MVAEIIEKPLTEAQQIVAHLRAELGMSYGAIAKETQITRQTVRDIDRGRNAGHQHVHRLRKFVEMWESQGLRGENAGTIAPSLPVIGSIVGSTVGDESEPAGISLNADEPAPAEPKNLKDRASDWLRAAMLGDSDQPPVSSMTAPARKKKSESGAVEQGDLIEQLVPLAALLFVLAGSVLIADPYKPCGPNQAEASAIAYPIVKRAVRELDARKRLSEATMDAVAILLALGAYGVRAQQTYQQIHAAQAEEAQRARSDRQPSGAEFLAASGGGGFSGHAAPPSADAGAGRGVPDAGVPLPFWRGNAGRARAAVGATGGEPGREPASPEQRRADASIDALLAADHAGRLRLGL